MKHRFSNKQKKKPTYSFCNKSAGILKHLESSDVELLALECVCWGMLRFSSGRVEAYELICAQRNVTSVHPFYKLGPTKCL